MEVGVSMKRDKNYLWLILIALLIMFGCMGFGNLYGSTTDWLSQHTVYPDYFRKLFYETGNLFPNLAFHIGAGENIYNFSYYGFLNPVYMISYFFPFVKMVDYIMIVSMLSILCSVLLCYQWLKGHFEKRIAFFGSLFFLCASPLIFHSHRHLMFVNYMPFLLLALMGVERHFEKKNSNLLIFSIFMMIMTSYYYSVGGICAVSIYAISYYIKRTEKGTLKHFLKEAVSYLIPFFLAILLSSILLLPTMHAILQGRTSLNHTVSFLELLIPNINMDALLYSSYSLGLTSISLVSVLFCLLDKRKDTKFLSVVSLIFLFVPIFIYLLNGTLYYRSKVLIPFLPLFIFQMTVFFEKLEKKKSSFLPLLVLLLAFFVVILLSGYHEIRFLIDFGVTVLVLLLFLFFKKKWLFYLPLFVIAFSVVISSNLNENYVSKENYDRIFSSDVSSLIQDTLKEDTENWYRMVYNEDVSYTMNQIYDMRYYTETLYSSTYHSGYKNFFDHEFRNPLPLRNILDQVSTSNGLFHMYMGSKYYISKGDSPIGYEKIKESGDISIYRNEDVLPIGYVSSKISSLKEYQETPYPYNLENLFQTVVVNHDVVSSLEHHIQEVSLDYSVSETPLKVEQYENGFLVQADKTTNLIINLKEALNQKYLFIQFDINEVPSCKSGDISITINGQKNKLTCKEWMYFNENTSFEYVISSNDSISSLEIEFSKGVFDIQNVQTYVLDYGAISKRKEEIDEFVIDPKKTKGDFISGTVEVTKDGYFILNVPYDKGFEVKVNGQIVETEVVNTTFLGFPLEKGTYQIDIVYHAPYQKEGKMLSCIAFLLWGIFNLVYFCKKRKQKQFYS